VELTGEWPCFCCLYPAC